MKRTVLASGILLITLIPTVAGPVRGQQPPADAQAGLKIAPTTYEATVTPGQPKDGAVDVFNLSDGPIVVEPRVENIRMVGDAGDLEFFIGSNPFRLDPYIQLDRAAFTLGKGEARKVPFRVTLPIGVPPGGYFGAVLFRTSPQLSTSTGAVIRQSGQVGTLLILTAPGEADRKGTIKQVAAEHPGLSTKVTLATTYANTGNTDKTPLGVAYRPKGTITIKNVFGRAVASQEVTGALVFPGAERSFSVSKKMDFWFGPYTAQVTLASGEGPTSSKTITFWVISWPVLLIFGGFLVIILIFLGMKRRGKPLR